MRPDRPRDQSMRAAVAMIGLGAIAWAVILLTLLH